MDEVAACAAKRAVFAREPLPLVRSWRQAVARAARPFWARFALHDLAVADSGLHARVLERIAGLDRACASEDREQLAAAGAALVEIWQEAAALMQARHAAADKSSSQPGQQDWLVKLAKLARWPGPEAQAGTAAMTRPKTTTQTWTGIRQSVSSDSSN
jgi:hypothetical protein